MEILDIIGMEKICHRIDVKNYEVHFNYLKQNMNIYNTKFDIILL